MAKSHNLFRSEVKISCPTIVAQSLPLAQHLILCSLSEGLNGGPAMHKALPIFPALFHLSLLEDNLGEPDGIRVMRLPPRQVAPVLTKPIQQCQCKVH